MNWLVIVGVRVLEFLFFAGWIGATLVLILTGVEDAEIVLQKKTEPEH